MEFELIELSNGLRIIYQQDTSIPTVHCGFMINAGSRDELKNEHGLAHLIEHCLFKGTHKRKAFHILSRLDSVGGEVNAYTTKEETCVYASALPEHFERASELLVDIVFSSNFPMKEIEKEKTVITDEINAYKEAPDEMLLDEFELALFEQHALGRSILGTKRGLAKFNRDTIEKFVKRLYTTDQMVFAVVGNISHKKLMRFCAKHLECLPGTQREAKTRTKPSAKGFDLHKTKSVHQVHAVFGGETVALSDEKRRIMVLLNNLLGGPALNSRLNMNIRERMGYCYYIESNYNPYTDFGLFQIYFGTDHKHLDKTRKLIWKELNILKSTALNERALTMAKKQLLGQMALAQEQRSSMMLSYAKSVLHFNHVDTFADIKDKVMSISAEDIQETSREAFDEENLSTLIYAPRNRR